jgi:hypothetical protein
MRGHGPGWKLDSLDTRKLLAQIVPGEAHRLPPALLDELYTRLVARPLTRSSSGLAARFAAAGVPPPDPLPLPLPLALIMIEPMRPTAHARDLRTHA